MNDFSAEWLDLREPIDIRARNAGISDAIAARFALREELTILDLGAGTGANLRALAPLLPLRQSWTLADNDPALRQIATARLIAWADRSDRSDDGLSLFKDQRAITVNFVEANLSITTDSLIITSRPQFVTASAYFDLTSEKYIRTLAKSVADIGAVFSATLTYSGEQRWTPHRPADNRIAAAFHKHQMRDKGFGLAAGPTASGILADQFRLWGYLVMEGESPWRLDKGDRMLIAELVRGYAFAAKESGGLDDQTIVDWVNVSRTAAYIGHTDVLAVPT